MNIHKNTPEALLPDNSDYYIKGSKQVRKGTFAAAIFNLDILESEHSTLKEKQDAIKILEELIPTLYAFGLNKHFIWRNPFIQLIFDKVKE